MALEGIAAAFPHLVVEMALACSWGDAHAIVVLVSEPSDQLDAEVEPADLARRRSELAGGGQVWVAQAALSGHSDAATLHIAGLLRVAQLQAPREMPTHTRFCTGASDAAYIAKSSEGTGVKADLLQLKVKAQAAAIELQAALQAAADTTGPTDLGESLGKWADAVGRGAAVTLPPGLEQACFDLGASDHLAVEPMMRRCTIEATRPIREAPAAQEPYTKELPKSIHEVLTTSAVKKIKAYLKLLAKWHVKIKSGKASMQDRPQPLALGKVAFQTGMWKWVWDLRGETPTLLDTTARAGRCNIDVEFMERLFADCADKELVGLARYGVRTKAELEPQIVIFPSLFSLYDCAGVDAVADEYAELERRGWYERSNFIPFAPWRAAPRGAVPRADGGPPRGIVDEGAPRKPLVTDSKFSEPVVPLNDACRDNAGYPADEPKWHPEVKPSFEDLMRSAAVLRHVADKAGLPIFAFAFDFKYFFHQLAIAQADVWQMGSVLPDHDESGGATDTVSAMSELAMAMGFTASSQIAQRLANATIQAFCKELERRERERLGTESEATRKWSGQRAHIPADEYGSQSRLFECLMYCDDPVFLVCGVELAVRALTLWHQLVGPTGLRLEYAKEHKWQAGTAVTWLGGCVSPALGVAWVPQPKVLRACMEIQKVVAGKLSVQLYRKLLGFVEHILGLLRLRPDVLGLLHQPLQKGGAIDEGLEALVVPSNEQLGVWKRIEYRLLNSAGVSLLACIAPGKWEIGVPCWLLQSDAAVEPGAPVQLGGVCYGIYWYLEIAVVSGKLTIPVAEFLAAIVNLIQHAPLLKRARHVLLETDALATDYALRKQHTHAYGMRTVLSEALGRPELQQFMMYGGIAAVHVAGEGNVLADAASRGKLQLLERLYAALGVRAQRQHVRDEGICFLEAVLGRLGVVARIEQGRSCDPPTPGGRAICFLE